MSIVIIKDLKCDTSKNNVWLFERHKRSTRTNTIIIINVHEHAQKAQGACRFKCLYSRAECWSLWSPHPWFVSNVNSPLGLTETAQCSIGPVALSSFTVQIQVKLSVQLLQYHGLTASL